MTNIVMAQPYTLDGVSFDGLLVSDGERQRPGVLVIHGWEGRSDAESERVTA